jgi:hypothetical protein
MSILDALRVQQAENSSVRDLAMLPQAQIMKLAQMGQIPAEVVPVIINEKARMAQQTAQMQASQAPMQPTVLEQAMAQNAQAEAPMTGVASIPTQMFDERNYASGGIVAFQGGGFADPTDVIYGEPTETYTPPASSPSTVSGIDAYIREAAARRAEARKPSEAMLALEKALGDTGRFQGARDEARNMALLQAGLGILGGASPYALQNIGRGAAGAAESYQRQLGDIRRQEREALGQRAALDVRKQEQALADIASGEAQYAAARKEVLEEKKLASREEIERQRAESAERRQESRNEALARGLSGGRQTNRAEFVADYVAGMREEGDKRPEAVLRLEGQKQFNNQQAQFDLQARQLEATIVNQVDTEILRRQSEMPKNDRADLRKWVAGGGTEREYWDAERRQAITRRFAESQGRFSPQRSTGQAPDLTKISGVPPGSTIGKFVEGKGWEVLQGGKVRGHIQED